jgi:hypothetical protein
MKLRLVAAVAVAACAVTVAPAGAGARGTAPRPVVAVVGDFGINPLHEEFRTPDGSTPHYPAGMPRPVMVDLPRSGSFSDQLAELRQGPLGHPAGGTLYGVRGTRLLLYVPPGVDDILTDRAHGTGVAASVGGNRTGVAKEALIVFVAGSSDPSYDWLSVQSWIDVASTSVYSVPTTDQCAGADPVRRLARAGGLLFSSSGNTYDAAEPLMTPNGLPEVYQVGGVDSTGRTYVPPHLDEPQPTFAAGTVVRPYESGARFSFPAASGDDLKASQPFGGTSGATPTVAGYAALLVQQARALLGDTGHRTADAMAQRPPRGPRPPARGPLADGRLTRDELVALLHHTATPKETPSPLRYAVEGYGATTARSHALALAVLRGTAAEPARPDEDAANAQVEALRGRIAARC